MTEDPKKSGLRALVDEAAKEAFGRTYTESEEKNVCVSCGGAPEAFSNARSEREWKITRLCQKCQDDLYGQEEL